ncbi:hypothetical protein [Mycobacterium sp. AZCC_0083]|uniref:hypothetical protein n=1 Tax=Mycobacterium sp. AZCC_0083 TaxID=2735882 RepID=UPI0016174F48|nr:hypothetical protein [Mycobacterium sp. AZCC_0083]MBB5167138.1 hypothetical protein [Mycobacterium sp. AZCC_0083]
MSDVDPSAFDGVAIDVTVNRYDRTVNYLFAGIPADHVPQFFDHLTTDEGRAELLVATANVLVNRGYVTTVHANGILSSI